MDKKHIYAILVKHYESIASIGGISVNVCILYTSPSENTMYYYDTDVNRNGELTYLSNKRYYTASSNIPFIVNKNPWLGEIEAVISHKKQLTKNQLTKAIESHLSNYITTRNNNE